MTESLLEVPPSFDLPYKRGELPLLYEDDNEDVEMGESLPHSTTSGMLYFLLMAHFADRPGHQMVANMNLYYHPTDLRAYVSPDLMVVVPPKPLRYDLTSYRIGDTGPAPILTVEVLSESTYEQGDLTKKAVLYAELGVQDYLLVDITGQFLPERLLLMSANDQQTWTKQYDRGEGVRSQHFGYCVRIDNDGDLNLYDATTGNRYPRPDEADELAQKLVQSDASISALESARLNAEVRIRELEAELARLRQKTTD